MSAKQDQTTVPLLPSASHGCGAPGYHLIHHDATTSSPPPFSNAPAKAAGVAAASVQKGLELMEDDEMDDEEYDIHTHRPSPSQTSLPPQDSPR